MPDQTDRSRSLAALRFRALGDETRLRLLEHLTAGERTVADLMEATGLGQSLVSHHLRTLRGAGLVTTRRDGSKLPGPGRNRRGRPSTGALPSPASPDC